MGAINAVTSEVVSVTNETYINAETVCQLLVQLSDLDLDIPITLVLDNASYQKCQFVKDVAGFLGIELLYSTLYFLDLSQLICFK